MPRDFVHLHVHSEYSLLDGAIKVEKLVNRTKELGMNAVALTDHGNMFGAVKFYRTARKENIKPIFGMEAYVTRGSRVDKAKKKGELSQINHLVLLAYNHTGYENLLRLSSIGYLEGFYYKPRIDMEALEQYHDGLIAMTSCLRGDIPQTIVHSGYDEAKVKAERLAELFGRENFYLELQDHGIEDEKKAREGIIKLSRDTGIPMVATNDAHYLRGEDREAHEVLLCLQTGSDFEDPRRFRFTTSELYFKTPEEMYELFSDVPEALENTAVVAERCDVELDEKTFHLPGFPLPEGFASNSDYLRKLAEIELKNRYDEITDEITKRLDFELAVIKKMDYDGYFLIVRDIVNFARASGIPVGPGRGSAAGSLLCYVLGITDVDPLEHGLIFERMLNPERISMPDIDIDFCFERRDEVIKYVIDRYGADNVCQIITFGTMAARGVVRDVGRVLKIPFGDVDRIAKLIPSQPGTTLNDAIETVPEIQRMTEDGHAHKKLMDLSLTLEGLTRHASIHAAGMIITPTPLTNHLPLYRTNKGEVTSQYDMKSAEAIGLLKIDVLGLRTLTVIAKAIRMIERNHGVTITPAEIPLDDDRAFELLKLGGTVGVFQLESTGMRDLLKNLIPESFSDIVAVNALYRPGPLGSDMVTTFVDCKHGRKRITYPLPELKPILKETYGVILYQEQVMKIAGVLANFSMGEADLLRKAMGKKDLKVMSKQRKKFVDAARDNKIAEKKAEKIFDQVEKFAKYGFNKSHSAAYAVISVRTAYLKAHYPAEFMAANLTSEIDDSDRIMILLEDCRECGIDTVTPDINRCGAEFEVWDGKIFYGLAAVKNVGMNAIKHIIAEREENGAFVSLYDFCSRISSRMVNRRVVESLIQSGALDELPGHRAQQLHNLERVLEMAARSSRDAERGQIALFTDDKALVNDDLKDCDEWSGPEKLRREKESLGLFLSGHPLDKFTDVLRMMSSVSTAKLKSSSNGKHVVVGGLVSGVKTTMDKRQNPMAFVTVEDPDGQAEAVMFSDVLAKYKENVSADRVLLLEGKVSCKNGGEGKLLVNNVTPIEEDRPPESGEVHITIDVEKIAEEELDRLKKLLQTRQAGREVGQNGKQTGDGEREGGEKAGGGEARDNGQEQDKGHCPTRVFFNVREGGTKVCVVRSKTLAVNLDYELLSKLSGTLGVGNIKLVPTLTKTPR